MKTRKNDLLGLARVDVIGASGEKLGVMAPTEALRSAREQGVDLVEVNPRAEPPVCKTLDLAKYEYEEAKKAAQARRVASPLDAPGAVPRRPRRQRALPLHAARHPAARRRGERL